MRIYELHGRLNGLPLKGWTGLISRFASVKMVPPHPYVVNAITTRLKMLTTHVV